jgi:transcription elongation factor Elf1
MNRPPQPADYWWKSHAEKCGGTYTKIDGPEMHLENSKGSASSGTNDGKGKKRIKKEKEGKGKQRRIDDVFTPLKSNDEGRSLGSVPESTPPRHLSVQIDDVGVQVHSKDSKHTVETVDLTNEHLSMSCPICGSPGFTQETINEHVDTCIITE